MEIYLCWARTSENKKVETAYTDEVTARNYCDYWNEHTTETEHYYTKVHLDRYAEIYKNKY